MKLAFASPAKGPADAELPDAQRENLRCQRAIQLLDQLEAIAVLSGPFTLRLIDNRVSQAPSPDLPNSLRLNSAKINSEGPSRWSGGKHG